MSAPVGLVMALLLSGLAGPPLDCGAAFATRNALAREESAILQLEADRGRLSAAERARLAEIRKRRRQLLVCG
ncbi:hypothetical protein [uncultured Enterovirga sp.]|uniref:hypothetical protein n=1 Tax=uncultured Enterovirga sp. TaxID=2026352 RepID=UPI0035CB0AEE